MDLMGPIPADSKIDRAVDAKFLVPGLSSSPGSPSLGDRVTQKQQIGLPKGGDPARCMEDQALWAQGAIAYETQIAGIPRGGGW